DMETLAAERVPSDITSPCHIGQVPAMGSESFRQAPVQLQAPNPGETSIGKWRRTCRQCIVTATRDFRGHGYPMTERKCETMSSCQKNLIVLGLVVLGSA